MFTRPPRPPDVTWCVCGRWKAYKGRYDADGYVIRCYGCLLACWRCTCGR